MFKGEEQAKITLLSGDSKTHTFGTNALFTPSKTKYYCAIIFTLKNNQSQRVKKHHNDNLFNGPRMVLRKEDLKL